MSSDIVISQSYLPHTGKDEAIGFYRDLLGFEVLQEVGYNDLYWITVAPAGHPEVAIVLTPPAVDPGVTEEERKVISEMMAKGTYGAINLATDDLDGTFARLQAADVDVVQEPMDQPYGIRDCALRDPAGNIVRIKQA
jgi:uncharacterized glyoxalase superfamily protein PhnB